MQGYQAAERVGYDSQANREFADRGRIRNQVDNGSGAGFGLAMLEVIGRSRNCLVQKSLLFGASSGRCRVTRPVKPDRTALPAKRQFGREVFKLIAGAAQIHAEAVDHEHDTARAGEGTAARHLQRSFTQRAAEAALAQGNFLADAVPADMPKPAIRSRRTHPCLWLLRVTRPTMSLRIGARRPDPAPISIRSST